MSFENLKNKSFNVGIIGAGPAGAMSAYLLAQKGYSVTLMERKKEVERKVCGEYLCPEGVNLLNKLGLVDRLCQGFDELNGMILVSPAEVVIPSYFPQVDKNKKEKGLSLNRKIFDQNLLNLAIEHGARFLSDKTIVHASRVASGKWVVVSDEETFEFDLLIVADGRQSKIGHALGHIRSIDTKRAAIHCYLPRKISRGMRLGEMHILNESSYCGLDPISDDEVNFSIVCDSSRLKSESAQSIINKSILSSKRLSAMFDLLEDGKKYDIRIVSSLKNKNEFIAGNNMAYVGDAAGFIDPLTGEGIYNALLSGHLLVNSLLESQDIDQALRLYKNKKKKISFQKNVLNHFFQFLIRKPFLVNLTASYLKKSPGRASQFIGIIGNIHGPIAGFVKMLAA